jgi:hypothetical protein
MSKVSLIITGLLFTTTWGFSQLETKVVNPNPNAAMTAPKKEVKAISYRLGDMDLCTIAPVLSQETFRVQFTVMEGFYNDFHQFVAERAYGEVYPEYVLNKNRTRYLLGEFYRIEDAKFALERLINLGHNHAFIVKYQEGQRVD